MPNLANLKLLIKPDVRIEIRDLGSSFLQESTQTKRPMLTAKP
jgi:hypothetical protein